MLRDVSYLVLMMNVGGYRPSTVIDFDLPERYGPQTIADTLGIGGIMRATAQDSGAAGFRQRHEVALPRRSEHFAEHTPWFI